MKAIIETGGKQYYVSENDVIYVEKLDVEENKEMRLLFQFQILMDAVCLPSQCHRSLPRSLSHMLQISLC